MTGIRRDHPDSELVARARRALAGGALDAVSLIAQVCAIPAPPFRVAERLAEALFARHGDFVRDAGGRWSVRAGGAVRGAVTSDPEQPLAALRFAVVDVETTGTAAALTDRVTEIAVVHVDGGAITGVYETLVNPERPVPPAIVALTGITWEMVKDAPRFAEVAPAVCERLDGRIFVAHNASFDWRFVSCEVHRAAGVQLAGDTLCTVRLARVLLPQLARRSLDAVTHHFGVEVGARHRAAGDAVATAHVLLRLLRLAEDQGVATWEDLRTLAGRRSVRAYRRRSALPGPVTRDTTA